MRTYYARKELWGSWEPGKEKRQRGHEKAGLTGESGGEIFVFETDQARPM